MSSSAVLPTSSAVVITSSSAVASLSSSASAADPTSSGAATTSAGQATSAVPTTTAPTVSASTTKPPPTVTDTTDDGNDTTTAVRTSHGTSLSATGSSSGIRGPHLTRSGDMPSNTGVAGPNNGGGSNVNVGALVGGIVGGVVGIALLLGLLWYYLKKKQAEDDDLYFASGGGIDSGPFSSGGGGNGGRHRSSVYDAEGPWAGSKASHDTGRSSPLPPGTDPDAVALIGINNSDPYAQPGGGGYGGGYGGYPPPQRWDEERGLGSSAGARLLDPSSSHARSTPRPAPTDYTNIVQHSGVGGNANFAPAVAGAPKPQQPYRSPWETPAAAATGASFRPPETLNAHQSTPGGAGLTTQFTITAYDARAGVGKVAAAVGVSGGGPAGGVSAKQVTSTRASSPALPPAYQPPSSLATPVLVDFKLSPIDDRPATGRLW